MEGVSLGSAYLRLYGDRSALDRELEKLRRYTDQLEKQGIKVTFDADTGKATREINGLQQKLNQLNQAIGAVGQGMRGDSAAWGAMGEALSGMGKNAAAGGGALGKMAGVLGGATGAAMKFVPVLGQLGMAAMGVQAIFQGVSGAINGILGPLKALASEAGRFNQQVAEGSIFAAQSFAVFGPDGKAIQGTANQMRALRGTITKEYKEIQKEVATISGATSAEIYEGFNLILQNAGALGKEGESLENIRKLSTKLAAGMNTLGIPGQQLRSEVSSLMTGDVQMYDQLAKKLGYDRAKIEKLKSEGKFYDDLMQRLEKLYDGQMVLAESLSNVASNFADVFQTISVEGGMAMERGLGKGLKNILDPLTELQGSFAMAFRGVSEALEPVLRVLGEIGGWLVSIGAALGSIISIVGDFAALTFNLIEALASPILRGVGKILQVIAKAFELCAAAVSTVLRPVSTFFRIFTNSNIEDIDKAFDPIINFFDELIAKTEQAAALISKPFREFLKFRAMLQGKNKGKTDKEIEIDQANIDAQFDSALGTGRAPSLKSLKFSNQTEALLAEIDKRYSGTEEERALARQREITQLVQDRTKNEIQGLEQVLRLMQAQKGVQEALSQLADARRGVAMQRVGFAVQVAASPEKRQEAEDRRNELANQQEQERIRERKALLGTERQMLQVQLQIQLKQQRIQQDQLTIQREEIRIQLIKAKAAQLEASIKMRSAPAGSSEQAAMREKFIALGEEAKLRQNQLAVMDQTIAVAKEGMSTSRQINALEQQSLGIKSEILDVEGQKANLTLQQQQAMSAIAKQEQAIKNALDAQMRPINDKIKAYENEEKIINQNLKNTQIQNDAEKDKLELKKAQLEASEKIASSDLEIAKAQQNARENPTVRNIIGAEIEALASGQRGQRDILSATKAVYDAKEKQLRVEQEMQLAQVKIQQEREKSELRIAEIQLRVQKLRLEGQQAQERAAQQQLGLQQQRDAIAGSVMSGGPLNAGPSRGGIANMLPGTRGGPNINEGVGHGRGRLHAGQDLGLDVGDPIHARRAGVVKDAYSRGFGKVGGAVVIKYDDGSEGTYGHVNPGNTARPGQPVAAGQRIATVAPDGQNTHLHYELRNAMGVLLNPLDAIRKSLQVPAGQVAGLSATATAVSMPGAQSQATAVPSLTNAIEENTSAQQASAESMKLLDDALATNKQQQASLDDRNMKQLETVLTAQQSQMLQLTMERRKGELTAEFLERPGNKFAGEVTEALGSGVVGAIRGAFQKLRSEGSLDIGEFMSEVMGGIADRVMETAMNALLAPLEDGLKKALFSGLTGFDPQEIEKQLAAEGLKAANAHQQAAVDLKQSAADLKQAAQAQQGAGVLPDIASPETMSIPIVPFGGQAAATPNIFSGSEPFGSLGFDPSAAFGVASEAGADFATSMNQVNESLAKAPTAAADATKGMQNFLGGMAGVAAGAMAIAGGIGQIGKGGTSNVLGGIGSILMGVGGALGSFGGMGLFGKRAAGGPVASQRPYLVGENGPELFMPGTSGSIGSSSALRDAMGGGGGGGSSSPVLNMSFESTNIGGVEYVSRDQLEQAMAATRRQASRDGAKRGMSMTLDKLQQSPATRSRLRMGAR